MMNPSKSSVRFPAEWEIQEAIWFAWPTRMDTWPGLHAQIRSDFAALYALAARFQKVRVLCPKSEQAVVRAQIASIGGDLAAIEFYDYTTDDVWCRDFGPIFLQGEDGRLVASSWEYNAWGEKFSAFKKDNGAPDWIAEALDIDCLEYPLILEGGAIESNGAGALLTTEAVLLNPNRSAEKGREAIEATLKSAFGLSQVHWLKDGLIGDDTDGHIDNLARFFAPDGILYAWPSEGDAANKAALAENLTRLQSFRQVNGAPYRLEPLPLPEPIFLDGQQLAASYLNFLVLNGAVLVPVYHQPESDQRALDILAKCFPGREIEPFDCRDILREGGALHCLSQPQPAF